MRNEKAVKIGSFAITVTLFCASAIAAELPKAELNASTAISSETVRKVGQDSFVELDTQVGAFVGFRLKALVLSQASFNLAIEGMYGASLFAGGALFPATYGGGVRGEYYLFSGKSHAWMISPGLDCYFVPAIPHEASPAPEPQNFSQAFGQGLAESLAGWGAVPTRVMSLSPNLDINWMYQFTRHFGFVAGAKIGAVILLNGTNYSREDLAGQIMPDLGLYIGTRF